MSKEEEKKTEAASTPTKFDLRNSTLCIGTWAWGGNTQEFGPTAADTKAQEEAFGAAIEAGVGFFDTAEIYSSGKSESLIGECITGYLQKHPEARDKIQIATKFIPLPTCWFQSSLNKALDASLARLQVPSVELYQVHGPAFSVRSVEVWAEAMAVAHKDGKIKSIGVSNYNSDQVERTVKTLEKHGLSLVSNQIEYSLLHRLPEQSGLIKACQDKGVRILAYSCLGMGRLTGKYTADKKPEGNRRFGGCTSEELKKLLSVMRTIAGDHEKELKEADQDAAPVTPAQVALNWVIAKGCVPICGSRNAKQVQDNVQCLRWSLTPAEVDQLDAASISGKSGMWQGSTK